MLSSIASLLASDFVRPRVDYHALAPEIILAVGICVVLMVDNANSYEVVSVGANTELPLAIAGRVTAYASVGANKLVPLMIGSVIAYAHVGAKTLVPLLIVGRVKS